MRAAELRELYRNYKRLFEASAEDDSLSEACWQATEALDLALGSNAEKLIDALEEKERLDALHAATEAAIQKLKDAEVVKDGMLDIVVQTPEVP